MAAATILRRTSGGRPGITLVDMVITVMIIGILAAVATPQFLDALLYHRAETAARRVKADLQWSRRQAISSSEPVSLQFDSATNSYTIPALPDLNRPDQIYRVDLTEYPCCATLVSAECGGDEELIISRFGTADSDATITVRAGKFTRTVVIDAGTGKVAIP